MLNKILENKMKFIFDPETRIIYKNKSRHISTIYYYSSNIVFNFQKNGKLTIFKTVYNYDQTLIRIVLFLKKYRFIV